MLPIPRLLHHYPALQALPDADLRALLDKVQRLVLPVGTQMFDEHQPCQGFPLLLSGSVRVVKSASNGRELQLYRVIAGESCILTSSCLLGHTPYQARGIVETEAEVWLLPAQDFHALLACYAPFRNYIFGLFSERLTELMELVTAVAFHKLDQRLAALLLNKTNPLHTTHQALADELGSAREIISRLLKGFSDQGWVRLGREHIEILNSSALKNFSTL